MALLLARGIKRLEIHHPKPSPCDFCDTPLFAVNYVALDITSEYFILLHVSFFVIKKKKRCCSYNAINKHMFFFVRTFKSFWGAVLCFHCAYFLSSEYLDWPRNTQNKWSKDKICCCLPLCSGTTGRRLCWKYLLHSSPLKFNRKCHLFYKTVMLFE